MADAVLTKSLHHILEETFLGLDQGINPTAALYTATVENTLTVTGASTLSGAVTLKQPVVSAAATLTAAQSGSFCLWNAAVGFTYTLPAAAAGLVFEFFVTVTNTSVTHKLSCAAGDFFLGSVVGIDTDTSNAVAAYTADGTTHDHINGNGTTTGGLLGTYYRVVAADAVVWMVSGTVLGSGIVATPFATS